MKRKDETDMRKIKYKRDEDGGKWGGRERRQEGGKRGGERESEYWSIRPVGGQTARETSVLVLPLSGLQTPKQPHLPSPPPCSYRGVGVRSWTVTVCVSTRTGMLVCTAVRFCVVLACIQRVSVRALFALPLQPACLSLPCSVSHRAPGVVCLLLCGIN